MTGRQFGLLLLAIVLGILIAGVLQGLITSV